MSGGDDRMFAGKAVLVTGAAAGIGRAAALLFAQQGARVAVADMAGSASGAVVDEIRAAGGEAIAIDCDVSDADAVKAMVARTVAAFGRLDSALNNAGVCLDKDIEWDDAAFATTFAVNVFGAMHCMKAEIPELLKVGGGTIVNTASIKGLISSGSPSQPGYTASKHALIGLTRTAALTYARQNIRVNAVCPGVTMTAMVEGVMKLGPEIRERVENFSPMGRLARPEEIAEAAVWLASPKSSFVNGHALVVDGGAVIQ